MILWEYFRKYLYNVVLYGGTEIHVQYSILEDRYESTTNVVVRKYFRTKVLSYESTKVLSYFGSTCTEV
jgi:hypothetical protein